ncbi:MAG: hypothetical protein KKB20_08895 [Proteobacteria bacterium]|nr:hypothetical protein [Pseudomonadota bacterium]
MLNTIIEVVRWACVSVGFFFAFSHQGNPVAQFGILCPFLVIPLAGLTGIESVFFARTAGIQSGYGQGGAYQRQSGLNNIATALTVVLVYWLGWGLYAQAAVMTTMLTFMTLSAANHAWSAIREGNRSIKNLMRPLMTAVLLIFALPFMVRALAAG